jgi:hypothetical protein
MLPFTGRWRTSGFFWQVRLAVHVPAMLIVTLGDKRKKRGFG